MGFLSEICEGNGHYQEKKLSSKLKHIQFHFFVDAQMKLILSSHILLRLKKRKPTKAVLHFDLLSGEENFPTIIRWCGEGKVYGLLALDIKCSVGFPLSVTLLVANKNLGRSFSTLSTYINIFLPLPRSMI